MGKSKFIFISVIFAVAAFFAASGKASGQSAHEIVKSMFTATRQLRTMTYTMKKAERINGSLAAQRSFVKLQRHPLKVYLRQEHPKAGMEVLYVEGANNNHARVNTNGFPWVTLTLDPYGSTMRNNQHHTIHDGGYDLFVSILEYLFNKYGSATSSMLKKDTIIWNGHKCHAITFDNPHFKYINYTVKPGETVVTIAGKYKLSEYMILEKNKQIGFYDEVKPGQVIQIPNDYAPRLVLYIDALRKIPLVMKVYDEKGLFEQYEYTNIILNPSFKAEEFDEEYPGYDF